MVVYLRRTDKYITKFNFEQFNNKTLMENTNIFHKVKQSLYFYHTIKTLLKIEI